MSKSVAEEIWEEGLTLSDGLKRILVLDFGSQYSHLICRRCRELGVYAELSSCLITLEKFVEFAPTGVIFSGGPYSVYEEDSPHLNVQVWDYILKEEIPVLGICYGLQEIVNRLGGQVSRGLKREYGHADLVIVEKAASPLFEKVGSISRVWMSHGDKVTKIPDGFEVIATTSNSEYAAIQSGSGIFGIQFHPEVTHSSDGKQIIRNFVVDICGCQPDWSMSRFLEKEIERIRTLVGDQIHVIGAISGGVDSSVSAALVFEALGDRFHPFLIDNGLLRMGECEEVKARLESHIGNANKKFELQVFDASEAFLSALKGVSEPEAKRKIIGQQFINAFERAVREIKNICPTDCLLLQGTLYPDVIESTSFKGPSSTIKSHHNVGGLPETMSLKGVLEPLRLLFKDEVRSLGIELGLPKESVYRHPFPGPGLAIRIIGEVTKERADILRQADDIYMQELHASNEYYKIGQAFAVLCPTVNTVGVMGDKRTYEHLVCLRAVETSDYMTADWYKMPYDLISRISSRIINEVSRINRVCYDVSSKPPATIEWE